MALRAVFVFERAALAVVGIGIGPTNRREETREVWRVSNCGGHQLRRWHGARCSFCEKRKGQCEKLIAGPGVYICDECVALCDILSGMGRSHRRWWKR